jgi:hypothetical protein
VVVFSWDGEGELARGGVGLGDRKGDAVRALLFVVFFVAVFFFCRCLLRCGPFCHLQKTISVIRRHTASGAAIITLPTWTVLEVLKKKNTAGLGIDEMYEITMG